MICKGDFESAREKLIHALELNPENAHGQRTLSKVNEMIALENKGNLDEKIVEISNMQTTGEMPQLNDSSGGGTRCCRCTIV